MKIGTKERNALANKLSVIGLTYHESACPPVLVQAVRDAGGNTAELEGIYCGDEGSAYGKVFENCGIAHTWYRMPSGRFEIVAYLT